jgi:hypothetical protein
MMMYLMSLVFLLSILYQNIAKECCVINPRFTEGDFTDLFNWYIVNDVLCGDMCVLKGSRYEGFVYDKLSYRSYTQIKKKDIKQNNKNDNRILMFSQFKIRGVTLNDGFPRVITYDGKELRLINMDGFFYFTPNRHQQQMDKLYKYQPK